jgi:hypothetical protein
MEAKVTTSNIVSFGLQFFVPGACDGTYDIFSRKDVWQFTSCSFEDFSYVIDVIVAKVTAGGPIHKASDIWARILFEMRAAQCEFETRLR